MIYYRSKQTQTLSLTRGETAKQMAMQGYRLLFDAVVTLSRECSVSDDTFTDSRRKTLPTPERLKHHSTQHQVEFMKNDEWLSRRPLSVAVPQGAV